MRLVVFGLTVTSSWGNGHATLWRGLLRALGRDGARRVAPLYGSVDPDQHRAAPPDARYRADLSYLGTYAADRQDALDALLFEPARRQPTRRFSVAGAQYPAGLRWPANVTHV